MTQEEKARAHDEAIKKAKKELQTCGSEDCDAARQIYRFFPELKESEDEKMRKGIIELVKQSSEILDKKNQERMLTWLEKKGDANETINNDELAQGVLRGAAINLITWIDYNAAEGNMCLSNVQCKEIENALVRGDWNKIYAYMKKKLEKQDEEKPIFDVVDWQPSKVDGKIHNIYHSGVEPKFHKFHESDWVVCEITGSLYQIRNCIESLSNHKYGYILTNGDYIGSDEVNHYHLWTIADAKPGDVLAFNNDTIVIFKDLYNSSTFHSYCHIEDGIFDISKDELPDWWEGKGFQPATKEQHDLLFSKMKEEGYVWDEVNKKLTKKIGDVERIQYDSLNCQKNIVLKWSEEDNKILVKIITALMDANNVECVDFNVMYNWLISIKERIEEQQ